MTTSMPSGFIGHGSPMNTLDHNQYTDAWRAFGETSLTSDDRPQPEPPTEPDRMKEQRE